MGLLQAVQSRKQALEGSYFVALLLPWLLVWGQAKTADAQTLVMHARGRRWRLGAGVLRLQHAGDGFPQETSCMVNMNMYHRASLSNCEDKHPVANLPAYVCSGVGALRHSNKDILILLWIWFLSFSIYLLYIIIKSEYSLLELKFRYLDDNWWFINIKINIANI